MTDIVGSAVTRGPEVKWYAGGVYTTESITVSAQQASAGITLASGAVAEYGSVTGTVAGTVTGMFEWTTAIGTAASESSGTTIVSYSGIAENDVVVLDYVATSGTALTHVASCQDVSCSAKADTTKTAIHGQATKIASVGAQECTATMGELYYSQSFIAAVLGDQVSNTPTTGKEKWVNKYSSFNKIGALVGKRYNTSNTVTYKIFLIGATGNTASCTFPTEDWYSRSMSFDCDYFVECDLS